MTRSLDGTTLTEDSELRETGENPAGWPPADSQLRGLAAAFNSARMLEYFRKHLRPTTEGHYEIRRCELSRVRYRKETRAVLQYSLHIVDSQTGYAKQQFVTGTIYPGNRSAHLARKLRKQELVVSTELPFEPVCCIPELKMLVQAFPQDRRLPSLPLLVSDPMRALQPALQDELGPGNWTTIQSHVDPVRYRAGLSAVLRCGVVVHNPITEQSRALCVYAKVYRDVEDAERTMRLLESLRSQDGAIEAVRPIRILPAINTLVLESASGKTLEEYLVGGSGHDRVRQFAKALAAFHQTPVVAERRHTCTDQIANVHRAAERLRWACPELEAAIRRVLAKAETLEDATFCPTHRDVKAEHVFFDSGRVVMIDWDSFAMADPLLDVAMLLARIAAMPMRHELPRDGFADAGRAFSDEYFRHVPISWRQRLAVHYAGAALEVAVGFFGRQEPKWREIIAGLVTEAEAVCQ